MSEGELALTVLSVARLDDAAAEMAIQQIRWGRTGGKPWCPECGHGKCYKLGDRKFWKCADCRHQFSATSETYLSGIKLSKQKLLLAAVIFTSSTKGVSSLDMARLIEVQGKTAFVLCHKFREAMCARQKTLALSGPVELDGAMFGGRRSPFINYTKDGKKRYKFHYKNRKCLVVARQQDRRRTSIFVGNKESQGALHFRARLSQASEIHVDGAHAWDSMHDLAKLLRVNHAHSIFKSAEGGCTNNAESFFSMVRRMQLGIHHKISSKFLSRYAGEMAWRQDARLMSAPARARLLLDALLLPGRSEWRGYWSRLPTSAEIVQLPIRKAA